MKIGGIPIRKKGKFEQSRAPQKPSMAEQQVNKPAKQPKQPRQSGGKKGWIIALALVAIVVLGVCSYGFVLKNQDAIYPNVYVAGVNVGGLKRDAAVSAVSEAVQTSYESDTLNVVLPDRTLSLTPEVTQVALNPEQAIDEAMRYGRSGGPISAVVHYLRAGSSEYSVDLDSSLNLDTTYIRTLVDQTARECASDKIDPIVKVDEAAGTITITAGSPAVSLDADKLYDAVIARFTAGDFSTLDFDYDTVPCESVDLQQYYDKYCKEMTDAYYDEEKKELVPEVNGYGFDLPTPEACHGEGGRGHHHSDGGSGPRVTLGGSLEKEYFSTCLRPMTARTLQTLREQEPRACLQGNRHDPQPRRRVLVQQDCRRAHEGKGLSAPSSTLTAARARRRRAAAFARLSTITCTLLADTEVTGARRTCIWSRMGMDATIYWPDYKFKNSTDKPLRIDASVSGGYVHIACRHQTGARLRPYQAARRGSTAWKTVAEVDGKKVKLRSRRARAWMPTAMQSTLPSMLPATSTCSAA